MFISLSDWAYETGQFACSTRYPGYAATIDGRVWSCVGKGCKPILTDRWVELTPYRNSRNRLRVSFGSKKIFVHQFVAECFLGPRPPGMECCHNDDDPMNNHVSNLRWDTPESNRADAVRNGKRPNLRGEKSGRAILKEKDIPEIFKMSESGMSQRKIAAAKGVARWTIQQILERKNWKHVQ